MAEQINISSNISRSETYRQLVPQLEALVQGEPSVVANLANIAAALKQAFGFFWVGFYLVEKDELVLGPFQGEIACTRISFGKGVCGTSWKDKKTIIVPDVAKFPGHIACSSASKSEIVVPVVVDEKVIAVLDVDSNVLNDFDHNDQVGLEQIANLLGPLFK